MLVWFNSVSAGAYDVAPDFELADLNGKTHRLSQYKGQLVYVDFWATWCAPCRKSFPWMEKMYQKFHDHGLQIIAISLDGKREVIDKFLQSTPVSFTVLRDRHSKTASRYKVRGMPSSFIVDRNGYIQYEHTGFREQDKQKLEDKLREFLLN